jgi:hypothetical protein
MAAFELRTPGRNTGADEIYYEGGLTAQVTTANACEEACSNWCFCALEENYDANPAAKLASQ